MRVALHLALAAFACAPVAAEEAASLVTLRGRVVDAQTGEPIAKALVSIRDRKVEAVTDAGGRFSLAGLPPGDAEITVATVGYGLARRTVRASADMRELEIRLGQDALKRSEEVAVIAAPFEPSDPAAPTEQQLEGTELRNLANVLTDDPLRSVQSLPGITTGDDFGATFATRGSGFTSLGFYVDGVLMNAPFHTIRDDMNGSFSLTLLNGDVVESVSLVNGGAPARYGDRIGSVLSVRTRDGSREEFSGRASLGTSGLYATLEGPIGAAKTTSWLVSARKSYLDYVLERIGQNGDIALGYYDVTAKLARSLTATQTLSLGLLHGQSRWRSTEPNLDPSDLYTADAGTDLATLRWRLFPSSSSWLETVAFFSRETGNNRSLEGTARFESGSSQWGLRSDATHALGRHRLQVGFLLRSLAEDVVSRDFDHAGASYRVTESYDASSAQVGAYLQDTWTGFDEHLTLTVGGRAERFSESGETRVEPRASLTWALSSQTRVLGAVGEYSQFPSFESLFGRQGNPELRAERSRHYVLSVEQGLGKNTRVRLEGYDQEHTGLLFAEDTEWRLEGDDVVPPHPNAPLRNALSGHSRGIELLLQRRSANGLSGWVAYSFGHARLHDEEGALSFDSDFDQRHTVTLFGSYRLGHTWNLSTKFRYGSGFPVPGFYQARPGGVFLAPDRNQFRPEDYARWDLRANRAFLFDRWKLTLYAEVINLLNRTHTRYDGLDGINPITGRIFLDSDTLFPILPSIGVTVEF
jgi:outer membrane cobalamin receptor